MVAERICRIPLADLKTIRLTCRNCGLTSEGSFKDTNVIVENATCGQCQHRFYESRHGELNPLSALVWNMKQLAALENVVSVEFVIPDGGDGKA